MAKVLVIRKPDRTVHSVPLGNRAVLMAFSNRLPVGMRWSFEEMDEKDAMELKPLDPNFVTAGEASVKLKEFEVAAKEKDNEIEALKAKLAALEAGSGSPAPLVSEGGKPAVEEKQKPVAEVVALIKAAKTLEEVNFLSHGDERKGVIDAAQSKIASLL